MADACPNCGLVFGRFEGQWIGAIGINTGGSTLWTAPIDIVVASSRTPTGPVADQFLEALVEPELPYAGQPIVYKLRLGISSSVKNFRSPIVPLR